MGEMNNARRSCGRPVVNYFVNKYEMIQRSTIVDSIDIPESLVFDSYFFNCSI